jgi:hypothetical protein
MVDLVILRLHPNKPMAPADFRTVLTGLQIDVYDLSFGDSLQGVLLGSASGLADPHLNSTTNNNVNITTTSILQHYLDITDLLGNKGRHLESVATAVVVASPPAGHAEYPNTTGYDLRLEITSGSGLRILDHHLDFNVEVTTIGSTSSSQTVYFGMSASAYVELPATAAGFDPNLAFVDLPPNGQPPAFDKLVHAIDLVLADDPSGTLLTRSPLTPAQSQHVAAEIVWNRVAYPPPEPDPQLGADPLGAIYTDPPIDITLNPDDIEKARPKFEAEQAAYYGTREAETLRLAGYVFSASAAVVEEQLSIAAVRAALPVPLITGAATSTTVPTANVALVEVGGLTPAFVVPAAVFYALAAVVPAQVGPEQRFQMARLSLETKTLAELGIARDAGVVSFPVAPLTGGAALTVDQAARRLAALGITVNTMADIPLAPPVDTLVSDWLAHANPTETIVADFWTNKVVTDAAAYLELILEAVTENTTALVAAIKAPPLTVASVAALVAVTDQDWRSFFAGPPPRTGLLPGFTKPGTPAERTEAFIRHLRTFFSVSAAPPSATAPTIGEPPRLGRSVSDAFAAFAASYPTHAGGVPFTVTSMPDPGAVRAAAADVFPGDTAAQQWLVEAVVCLCALWSLTDVGVAELHFSLIEALYARGFTSAQDLGRLSLADFQHALTGSVAYPYAAAIYARAGADGGSPPPDDGGFNPVNPNGALVDCVPPEHLSPSGPVAYLHELLMVSAASSCEDPLQPGDPGRLGQMLAQRRGPLGDLQATQANLGTPLPVIDLVNESLEALIAGLPGSAHGAVYDTAADQVGGHLLAADGEPGDTSNRHDPATLFDTLPEHSSPATPVAVPAAYDILRNDFSNPDLPYSQPLDVNRSYLAALRSSRFSVLRHFRRDITEFAIDAAHEPAEFLRHQWRYPLRSEIALEYLGISAEEYAHLYGGGAGPALHELYGFESEVVDGRNWLEVVRKVPRFVDATGLTYCEFVDLWRAGVGGFQRWFPEHRGDEGVTGAPDGAGIPGGPGVPAPEEEVEGFPDCQPCCPDNLVIDFGQRSEREVLGQLVTFIRLWRRLAEQPCLKLSMTELSDVAQVLGLFDGAEVNPDFVRQLAAFTVLRELLCLPLRDQDAEEVVDAEGADRTHLLSLWVGPAAGHWNWAVTTLLNAIDQASERAEALRSRQPELDKIRRENLNPLSVLAGFDPSTPSDTWHHRPTSTLRFAEVLLKISISEFTVGEVVFLFSNEHLGGDDPFPMQPPNEALGDPLALPDDDAAHGLWALRRKLLDVAGDEGEDGEDGEDQAPWGWDRIAASLAGDFGYDASGADPLTALGEHFFPAVLEAAGHAVPADRRLFTAALAAADTTPTMWNSQPAGPFWYDAATETLRTRLPLSDAKVAEKLASIRPLRPEEQAAVRELYFAPRAMLARFGLVLENHPATAELLIHEGDEDDRFGVFAREYARFRRRAGVVAAHLADHIASTATQPGKSVGAAEIWRLLRSMYGDENAGTGTWEDDSGAPPGVLWPEAPTGGAFAALLALTGTGLVGELSTAEAAPAWREMRGPLTMFGDTRNEWNAPVPTVIPALDLTFTAEQLEQAAVRNGFALRDVNGEPLRGAQPFQARWSGTLLVEHAGAYQFAAGAPTPDGETPDHEHCPEHRWRVTISRGQKNWQLLNRGWPGEDAPDHESGSIDLRRGAYHLVVELAHDEPTFADPDQVQPRHTGFQLKYEGPDTEGDLVAVPQRRLYREEVAEPLGTGIDATGSAAAYQRTRYTGSLRDIRRTYQRAFKAALLAHRFRLSADPLPGDTQSELGYLLDHPEPFAGQSYFRTGAESFGVHRAWFDSDLLPVADTYHSPSPAADQRAEPSPRRQAALFDTWERLYDYVCLRAETAAARERPAWRLFYKAAERQPDDPAELVRNLGIDVRHAPQVLTYFDLPADYHVTTPDMESESWPIRAWRAEVWIDRLDSCFHPADGFEERPHRWAADDPAAPPDAGNDNLTRFVQDGCFENGRPRRYADVRALDDALRVRARDALVAWLCRLDRVALPFAPGSFATRPRDLSDLLLQDVETGTGEHASRIEDAISCVQAFVQRARLGLEPGFTVSEELALLWDSRFSTFHEWQCCAERDLYRENWIEWDELRRARRVEAFRLLEGELREAKLTVAVPGGLEWWPGRRPPAHPCLEVLQVADPSKPQLVSPVTEGLDLLGTPDAAGEPSWLAPVGRALDFEPPGDGGGDEPGGDGAGDDNPDDGGDNGPIMLRAEQPGVVEFPEEERNQLPLWLQAAIRLGTRFVRVAAAGVPTADSAFEVCEAGDACRSCGSSHEPLLDEYYFWLEDGEQYAEIKQEADTGLDADDETSDWHRPEELPSLLYWKPNPVVYLSWTRVHRGRLLAPGRSTEPVRVDPTVLPAGEHPGLYFMGRTGDSLRFEVSGGVAPLGYDDPTAPGFRYDLATHACVVLPQVVAAAAPAPGSFPGDLPAYPYFAYVCPGAPVEPLSLYSAALTVAGVLRTHCQFEAALKWYELIDSPLTDDNAWTECDRLPPPDDGGDGEGDGDGEPVPVLRMAAVEQRRGRGDEPCCPTIARDDDRARERAVLLHFLETMLDWGDALMGVHSPEASRRAEVVLDAVGRILGDYPATVHAADDPAPQSVDHFVAIPARLNPRLKSLYERIEDRRGLVHSNLNGRRLRNGRPVVDMPYFGDDPRRDGWCQDRCGCGGCCCDGCCGGGCFPYRFTTLVGKATELAGEVRALGASLLSAYEKGDAEHLAALRAAQERQLLELGLAAHQMAWRDADWQVQALGKTKEAALARIRYYQNLIAGSLIAGEEGFRSWTLASMGSRLAGNALEGIAQGIGGSPDFWIGVAGIMGSPLQFNQIPAGQKLAAGFATGARIMQSVADIASTSANLSLTNSGWDRREAEWRHQVTVISIEIEQIERQILGAERRRAQALRELNIAQRQIEHSAETQHFLRDKFTSHDLYLYLQRETAALYYRAYELARCAAERAEHAFNLERGHTTRSFLPVDEWQNLRAGLLAGERLAVGLRQMEKAYLDENCREYELTKHVSLRLHFPEQFLRLQAGGTAEVNVPEWMFDLDYPGHYMRRIKNVSLTIPCVVGPYTGVHCRLTLLSSSTRVDPRLGRAAIECCHESCDCGEGDCGCGCQSAAAGRPCCCCADDDSGYEATPSDARVVRTYAATEAIATSSGQSDSGLFEVNFRDERYLPFELAGAVSRWRIDLPPETNYFDLASLSDVVLHVNYTAREGGENLRAAAARAARCRLPGDGWRMFDVRRDMPDAWSGLLRQSGVDGWTRGVEISPSGAMFPYIPRQRVRWVDRLQVLIEAPCADPSASLIVRYAPPGGRHHDGAPCSCDRVDVACVASKEFPRLFWGEVDLSEHGPLGPLSADRSVGCGRLQLPDSAGEICDIHLLVSYCTDVDDGCGHGSGCECDRKDAAYGCYRCLGSRTGRADPPPEDDARSVRGCADSVP